MIQNEKTYQVPEKGHVNRSVMPCHQHQHYCTTQPWPYCDAQSGSLLHLCRFHSSTIYRKPFRGI